MHTSSYARVLVCSMELYKLNAKTEPLFASNPDTKITDAWADCTATEHCRANEHVPVAGLSLGCP